MNWKKLSLLIVLLSIILNISFPNLPHPQEYISQLSTSAEDPQIYSLGLLGYYPMNEGEGASLIDHSNNENNGTVFGATWADGILGKSLNFDGVDDYVHIDALPFSTGKLTVSV
ncbi:MAG: hypothetical protein ACFFAJ_10045 [Candidatus Hodarchaeota archaeon]